MPLVVVSVVFALFALAVGASGVGAVRGRHWYRGLVATLSAALLACLAALAGAVALGVQGYRALTLEEVAATVRTEPLGPQRFRATITLADSSLYMFDLTGDALYVDAHILKWHPVVNILGLHTAYELDRISGRYDNVADERARPRTIHSLAEDKPFNAFDLARLLPLPPAFLDAQYGSATFVEAREPALFEVRVSTTGLLVRQVRARRGR
jgi:hypothetical protein